MDMHIGVRGRFIDIVEEMFNSTLKFPWLEHAYQVFLQKAYNLTRHLAVAQSAFAHGIRGHYVIFGVTSLSMA